MILETFRLNGRLLAAGDKLIAPLGLSSARWQVLGAIHYAPEPQTVSWLARNMGLTRQAVQRIVNEMEAERLVAFKANPAHRRAHLVMMTRKGEDAFHTAQSLQEPWVSALAANLDRAAIEHAVEVLQAVRLRLEDERGPETAR